MKTRLGFAIATAGEPEILLLDEGIGTGDARFAERATRRMKEFMGRSRILVLASHSEHLIKSVCNKAALMQTDAYSRLDQLTRCLMHIGRTSAAL